jgi:hypothetical protein
MDIDRGGGTIVGMYVFVFVFCAVVTIPVFVGVAFVFTCDGNPHKLKFLFVVSPFSGPGVVG